ncbi:lebocin-4-like [Pectinophora gossypiella]|uniref:lebocin-4-like n=1 Tax=Pectinophora gossypiella TaxID=13191 RepID=UPI00214EB112|nr:lebocin-4-like [Pectinophora gossypiella]
MVKLGIILVVCVALIALIADVTSQPYRYYRRRYTPRVRVVRIRLVRVPREVRDEPQWLWQGDNIDRAPASGDHPILPSVIDDIKLDPNRRHARSVDSPSARRHGGQSSSGDRRDTGPTHPGYNRRNARSVALPDLDSYSPMLPLPYGGFAFFDDQE